MHNLRHDTLRPDLDSTGHLTDTSEKPFELSQVTRSRSAKNNYCFYFDVFHRVVPIITINKHRQSAQLNFIILIV
jgi:hypothetical protein